MRELSVPTSHAEAAHPHTLDKKSLHIFRCRKDNSCYTDNSHNTKEEEMHSLPRMGKEKLEKGSQEKKTGVEDMKTRNRM